MNYVSSLKECTMFFIVCIHVMINDGRTLLIFLRAPQGHPKICMSTF